MQTHTDTDTETDTHTYIHRPNGTHALTAYTRKVLTDYIITLDALTFQCLLVADKFVSICVNAWYI